MVDSTADRLGVLKLQLNNISRNKFGGNEYRTFFVLAETKITFFDDCTFWWRRNRYRLNSMSYVQYRYMTYRIFIVLTYYVYAYCIIVVEIKIPFLAFFRNSSMVCPSWSYKLMRKSINDLFKVPSWSNFLKDKILYAVIEALLLVEI